MHTLMFFYSKIAEYVDVDGYINIIKIITILKVKKFCEGAVLTENLTTNSTVMLPEKEAELFIAINAMSGTYVRYPISSVFN